MGDLLISLILQALDYSLLDWKQQQHMSCFLPYVVLAQEVESSLYLFEELVKPALFYLMIDFWSDHRKNSVWTFDMRLDGV